MDNKVIWRLWKIAFKLPNWWLKVNCYTDQFSSVAQSCLTLCDPMDCSTPREPCPSPTPGTCSNSCPSSRWCHPAISSSVVPFSSCLQSVPASESFPMNLSRVNQLSSKSGLIQYFNEEALSFSPELRKTGHF